MTTQNIETLANLLVEWHNQIHKDNCSFYGEKMDKALCRDTFSTLFTQGDYRKLCEIRDGFKEQ